MPLKVLHNFVIFPYNYNYLNINASATLRHGELIHLTNDILIDKFPSINPMVSIETWLLLEDKNTIKIIQKPNIGRPLYLICLEKKSNGEWVGG